MSPQTTMLHVAYVLFLACSSVDRRDRLSLLPNPSRSEHEVSAVLMDCRSLAHGCECPIAYDSLELRS